MARAPASSQNDRQAGGPQSGGPQSNGSPPEDEDGTLRRSGGERGLSLSEKLIAGLASRLYATPLHNLRLRGRFPLKLLGVPVDPVPGNPQNGERILAGRLIHAGHTAMLRDIDFRSPSPGNNAPPAAWQDWVHSWQWLRDLSCQPDRRLAEAAAEALVKRWLDQYGQYDAVGWRADVMGMRLLMALGHAPLILSSSDQIYRSSLLSAIATWARHLDRAARSLPEGLGRAQALCALYAAGTVIPGGSGRAETALAGLQHVLPALVLPDGGIASRTPVDGMALADLLLFTAGAPEAVGVRAPPIFADTLARLVPALRGLMLGDGQIGAWHGGAVISSETLDRVARRAATGAELRRGGRWSGYYRLSAGRTVVVVDAGPPPPARLSNHGHAGTLAFEMSDGTERLITNCGGARGLAGMGGGGGAAPLAPALVAGLCTTAAHSTLVIDDTNSTRIRPDGTLGAGVDEVSLALRSAGGGQLLDASHDGYARRYGLLVRRRLLLTTDGTELAGEDVIEAAPARLLRRQRERRFDLRFHLGPGVSATPTADGMGALLKTPGGRIWAFKARRDDGAATLSIEASIWVDSAGVLHRTQQLVVSGSTEKRAADLHWSLKRAGK